MVRVLDLNPYAMRAVAAVLVAPEPPRRPTELVTHGDVRVDDYYWLRDDSRTNPEVGWSAGQGV